MHLFRLLWRRLKRVYEGFDTPYELFLLIIDHVCLRIFNIHSALHLRKVAERIAPLYRKDGFYDIGGQKFLFLRRK